MFVKKWEFATDKSVNKKENSFLSSLPKYQKDVLFNYFQVVFISKYISYIYIMYF